MAKVETQDVFENNRAAAIEVDIFSDTNVRMSVGMHLHVCTSCIFNIFNNISLLCIYNIFICALLRMYVCISYYYHGYIFSTESQINCSLMA